jgi:predicted DNA-binding protein (UPF0251 family)
MEFEKPKTKLHHDEKLSTKLTLDEIEQIRLDFPKNPNFKIFSEKYNVTQKTIKYWIDEDYRQRVIERSYERNNQLRLDDEYRIKCNKLAKERYNKIKNRSPELKEFMLKRYKIQRKQYKLKNEERVKEQDRIRAKRYYYKKKNKHG